MSLTQPDRTLYEAVQILTRPHDTDVTRGGAYLFTRHDPALIPALRNAIHDSVGGSGGGGTTPSHQRSLFSPEASDLYRTIETRIRRWVLATGYIRVGPWPQPEQLLRTWHAAHRGDTRPYEATLRQWIGALTDLLVDPPRRWSLGEECPICGHRWAITPDGRVDALHVVEREPAHDSETICRNCSALWEGVDGARALALAIDQRNHARQASA